MPSRKDFFMRRKNKTYKGVFLWNDKKKRVHSFNTTVRLPVLTAKIDDQITSASIPSEGNAHDMSTRKQVIFEIILQCPQGELNDAPTGNRRAQRAASHALLSQLLIK